jgi:Tfp pilus assembly protein PilV
LSGKGRTQSAEDGFAAVDAMVALVILSMTIVLALTAVQTARRAAVAAEETRRATSLLRHLVDSSPPSISQTSGHTDGFAWHVQVLAAPPSDMAGSPMCAHSAELVSDKSGRRFRLATAAICPPARPS